jgi:hypothetical protein
MLQEIYDLTNFAFCAVFGAWAVIVATIAALGMVISHNILSDPVRHRARSLSPLQLNERRFLRIAAIGYVVSVVSTIACCGVACRLTLFIGVVTPLFSAFTFVWMPYRISSYITRNTNADAGD